MTDGSTKENQIVKINVGEFKIGDEEREAIFEVLESGRISEGEKTAEFEKQWAKYVGTSYSVATSSGTSALIVGLEALKHHKTFCVKSNTKIITTPLTYIATSNSIVVTGFEPIYVDIDKNTFCITPEGIKIHLETINDIENYSLILPVHLMGYMCNMEEINKVAKKYGLITFEDSAQAHGSTFEGKKAGSLSALSDFSFYIAHNIQAGELGAVTTNDYELLRLMKKLKANGRVCDCPICTRKELGCPRMMKHNGSDDFDPRFTHELIGYNFKTMEFQAALALVQMKRIDEIIMKRQENVKYLNDGLENFSDILKLPVYNKNVSYLAYPIVIKDDKKISRKKLRAELEKRGIESRPLFGCIPTQQPAYSHMKSKYQGKLPVAEYAGSNGFYLGCHQYLNNDHLNYILKAFRSILK
jgi:CDP-6-deoxy-D-xylo-4-hexulose-3-dehydrase